jgi:hypothetical protein
MDTPQFEGTWEDVLTHSPQLAGHRVRVTVLDHELQMDEVLQCVSQDRRLQAFHEFTAEALPNVPLLSDAAISRENLYAERG